MEISAETQECTQNDINRETQSWKKKKELKRNACLYCRKRVTKLSRHLQKIHPNKVLVRKVLALRRGSQDRLCILNEIRKRGNFDFNQKNNKFIVVKRSKKANNRSANQYLPCVVCKGYFAKNTLSKHLKKCSGINTKSRYSSFLGRLTLDEILKTANLDTRIIFSRMQDDAVVHILQKDFSFISWCNKLKENDKLCDEEVTNKLRLTGRLLITCKHLDSTIQDLSTIYDSKNYETVIKAVKIVAKFNSETDQYEAPSVIMKLGSNLRNIGNHLLTLQKSEEDKRNINAFLESHKNYSDYFHVGKVGSDKEKKKRILRASDMEIDYFFKLLERKRKDAFQKVNEQFTSSAWKSLSETTLVSIQLLNECRSIEIETLYTTDFKQTNISFDNISKYIKLSVCHSPGKTISVLISAELMSCVKLIEAKKSDANVNRKNPYVFGTPLENSERHCFLHTRPIIEIIQSECGIKGVISLSGKHLREKLVTKFMKFHLSERK